MPNWKKVVVSGSDAMLNSLYTRLSVTSSYMYTGYIDMPSDNPSILPKIGRLVFHDGVLQATSSRAIFSDTASYLLNAASGTVTSVGLTLGSSGTDVNIVGSPIQSSGSITLNLPTASPSARGLLTSTDWNTFNNKVDGSGAATLLAFWSAANTLSSNANLYWNNTLSRLGINTSTPTGSLEVKGSNNGTIVSFKSHNSLPAFTIDNNTRDIEFKRFSGAQFAKTLSNHGSTISIAEFDDYLINAEDKFVVTYASSSSHPLLYKNIPNGINWNITTSDSVTINFTGKGFTSVNGLTYPEGYIYIYHYYTTNTDQIKVTYKNNVGTEYDASSTIENVSYLAGDYKVYRFKIAKSPLAYTNYLVELKIEFTAPTQVSAIRYITEREVSTGTYLKSYGDTLYGSYIIKDSSNQNRINLNANGNSYISSSLAINKSTPSYTLDVNGSIRATDTSGTPVNGAALDANGKLVTLGFLPNSNAIISGSDANLNSLDVTTNVTAQSFTGSLFGTASYSTQAVSSSYAVTASYALNGGGGGITWVAKTANYTAVAGDGILANTSGGEFTVTLPASPTIGDTVAFSDAAGEFNVRTLTIARNGSLIQGLAEDLVVDVKDVSFQLIYNGATTGWKLDSFLPIQETVPSKVREVIMSGSGYTVVLSDANMYLRMATNAPRNAFIPTNASVPFPIDTEIHFEQAETGQVTVSGSVGVELYAYDGRKTKGQFAVVTAKKWDTNKWTVIGGTA